MAAQSEHPVGRRPQVVIHPRLGLAMATGVLMVFAVLVLLFARVFQPVTILCALPLSIGGAVLALMSTGFPLSLLVIVPAAFTLVDDFEHWLGPKISGGLAAREPQPAT